MKFRWKTGFDLEELADGSPAHDLVNQVLVSPCQRWVARCGRPDQSTIASAFRKSGTEGGKVRRLFLPDVAGDQPVMLDWSPDGAPRRARHRRTGLLVCFLRRRGLGGRSSAPRYRHARTIRMLDAAAGRVLAQVPCPLSSSPPIVGLQHYPFAVRSVAGACGTSRSGLSSTRQPWTSASEWTDRRIRARFKFLGDSKFVTLDKIQVGTKPTGEKEFRQELSVWDVPARTLLTRTVVKHADAQVHPVDRRGGAGIGSASTGCPAAKRKNELLVFRRGGLEGRSENRFRCTTHKTM